MHKQADNHKNNLAIGIDLGTTNSCISLFRKGRLTVLENPLGARTTPSYIYFQPEGGIVIGKHAKKISNQRPENGIYEVKRLIGRNYDDRYLQNSLKYLSYNVKRHPPNFPVVSLKQKGNNITRTPQQLYTILLKELKNYAEERMGQTITSAVITVPAYFNVLQREITLSAAKDAGFNVLKLLNEPTAAAITFYHENDFKENRRCLVYDLGGGTFDIAVLEKHDTFIEVICVSGDSQLGGHDFDKCILKFVCQELKEKYQYDVHTPEDKRKLRNKCEEAKKDLSTAEETVIVLNGMVPAHPRILIQMTRRHFEDLVNDLVTKTIDILDGCLSNSKIPKESIHDVILCGGSTRIVKIQQLLSSYFNGKKLNKFVNPDEAVAEGAALQAAMLSNSQKQQIDRLKMVDVVAFSLGFESLAHKMNFLIRRNTKIPVNASYTFRTVENNQDSMPFRIYEGERLDARKNRLLGTFVISDLSQAPPGQVKVIATLSIDHNGIITATAREEFGTNMKELKISYTRGDQSDGNNSFLENADDEEGDKKFRNFVRTKCYLIEYCTAIMYNMEKKKLIKKFNQAYEICRAFKDIASNLEMDREFEVKTMTDKCKEQCEFIAQKYKFKYMPIPILYK